ncbi:hypothetical protein BGZ73_005238 [Actinomortierella ambigua]|nr:hypothetical protein BGZ73_005238 [Actinomortierella ambigua]
MVHPGLIVAVSFGVIATGVVLYTIFSEELHDMFQKPAAVPGDSRYNNSRRRSDDRDDGDSSEGFTTARGGSHHSYELRSRRGHSDNEKEKDEDDDDNDEEHKHLLNKQREIERREQELAQKMARLEAQERLLNEREERLKQQLAREQDISASVIAARRVSSPPSTPNEMSQSGNYFLMPSMNSSMHEQQHGSNTTLADPFADSCGISHHEQRHPLELPPSSSSSSSRATPVPAPLSESMSVSAPAPASAPAAENVDNRSPADAILHHDLSEDRNPFEESSIYMDTSSSATIREDMDEESQRYQQQEEQQQQHEYQNQFQEPTLQAHPTQPSTETEDDGEETDSFHGGVSSDPEWVEADVDSDFHSNFSDYDDWSSSSALSP